MASMDASSSKSIEDACGSLSISDDVDVGLTFGDEDISGGEADSNLVLVGRFNTTKPIKFLIMRDTMVLAWKPVEGVSVEEVAPNLFLFQFYHEFDMNRILEDGPWAFEQNLLLLKKLGVDESPLDVVFEKAEFWIQVHKLPRGFINERVARGIGAKLGDLISIDQKNFSSPWKAFIRLRVAIDISKPLKKEVKLRKEGGEWFSAELKYERLPNFCFLCGVIGHMERIWREMLKGVTPETERPFGAWMRASNRRAPLPSCQQWLRSDPTSGAGTKRTTASGVAMDDPEVGVQTVYEELMAGTKDSTIGGENAKYGMSGVTMETNEYNVVNPTLGSNPNEQATHDELKGLDQKRKRSLDLSTDIGPSVELMDSDVPTNVYGLLMGLGVMYVIVV